MQQTQKEDPKGFITKFNTKKTNKNLTLTERADAKFEAEKKQAEPKDDSLAASEMDEMLNNPLTALYNS